MVSRGPTSNRLVNLPFPAVVEVGLMQDLLAQPQAHKPCPELCLASTSGSQNFSQLAELSNKHSPQPGPLLIREEPYSLQVHCVQSAIRWSVKILSKPVVTQIALPPCQHVTASEVTHTWSPESCFHSHRDFVPSSEVSGSEKDLPWQCAKL